MKWIANQRTGQHLANSPLSVAELLDVEGDRATTGERRSHPAAEVAHTGRALAWSPARNDTSWCGTSRTYKTRGRPLPAAADDES
ncbi:MAG: hypothetical protein AB7W59_30490 [Acidimicrobiia bacterium]